MLMKKMSKKEIIILKVLKQKYPNEKFVIICADIEDQITDLKI